MSWTMTRGRYSLLILALSLAFSCVMSAVAVANAHPISVGISSHSGLTQDLKISFRAGTRVPKGGYFYAVLVLKRYPRHARREPLECSGSSNLENTEYGYPSGEHEIHLVLLREAPPENAWCSDATYEGAVYAVPHTPTCNSEHPCSATSAPPRCESRQRCSPATRPVRGEIHAQTEGPYPRRLPAPLGARAHIVARFHVHFPAAKPSSMSVTVPTHPSVAGDVNIAFTPSMGLPTGGYYYAVLVLTRYYAKHLASAPCAKTSNMEATEYGYPNAYGYSNGGQPVGLTLRSETLPHAPLEPVPLPWCAGATYKGGIYAVSHPPPCLHFRPCYGDETAPECYEGEPLCANGHQLFGVVAREIKHPGALPRPTDDRTRIIAEFTVGF